MSDAITHLNDALGSRYSIERELGQGGMSTVYLAEDSKHGRKVAIKVLLPHLASSIGPERFMREITIASRLQHPHILTLFDSGDANGHLFYTMPFVEGESLRERLAREGKLEVAEAIRIAKEVASALTYAHEHGIVHRDVKPGNILLSGKHAIVADFGIARAIESAGGEALTGTGFAVGTPAYMSPEQALGESTVDGSTDVYALGCVLYEMVSGAPPFSGHLQAVVAGHISGRPDSLSAANPDIPLFFERAVEQALSKKSEDRFATPDELADVLESKSVVEPQPSSETADAGSSKDVTARQAAHFTTVLADRTGRLGGRDHNWAVAEIERWFDEVLRAWHFHLEVGDLERAAVMVEPLRLFFDATAEFDEARTLFSDAVSLLETAGSSAVDDDGDAETLRGHLLATRGHFERRSGSLGDAARDLQEAIETLSKGEGGTELAFALNSMGDVLVVLGKYEQARLFCERAYTIFDDAGDPAGIAASANNLGVLAQRFGDLEDAEARYQGALAACEKMGDQFGAAMALNNLGVLAHERGQLGAARQHYERARTIAIDVSDRHGEASALANLARVAHADGDADETARFASGAMRLFEGLGDAVGLGICQLSLGDAHLLGAELTEAKQRFRSALSIALRKQADPLIGESLIGLSAVALAEGRPAEGIRALQPTIGCASLDEDAARRRDRLLAELDRSGYHIPSVPEPPNLRAVARAFLTQSEEE